MKIKKTIFVVAVLCMVTLVVQGMENKKRLFSDTKEVKVEENKSKKIKINAFKKLPYPKEVDNFDREIKVFGGKNKKNEEEKSYKEYLDIREKCLFSQSTFNKLIKGATKEIPFILAATMSEGKESNDGKKTFERFYFSAPSMYTWMFKKNGSFQRKEKESFNKNILTQQPILKPVHFFKIDSLEGAFTYVGDENLFAQDTAESDLLKFNIIAGLDDSEKLLYFGCLYAEQNKVELAEKYYLLAVEKGHVDAMNNLGFLYGEQNKFELAEKYLKLAVEKGSIDALCNLGDVYCVQDKLELAEKCYQTVIEKNNHGEALNNLGYLYQIQKKYELAEKQYLLAVEKHNHAAAIYNLGGLYKEQKKYELAEKYYILAIETYNAADAMCSLGHIYEEQNKFALAEQYYLCAVEKHSHINAMNNLGVLYKDQNKLDLAEKYLKDAIEMGSMRSYYHLGMIYKDKNDAKIAQEYFKKAAEGGDEDAKKELGLIL